MQAKRTPLGGGAMLLFLVLFVFLVLFGVFGAFRSTIRLGRAGLYLFCFALLVLCFSVFFGVFWLLSSPVTRPLAFVLPLYAGEKLQELCQKEGEQSKQSLNARLAWPQSRPRAQAVRKSDASCRAAPA
ncbi:MAG: hypothetical protein JJT85_05385 [Chromatiales bacterium]|nr:hypothetical protein [Chromatiales bacterium]